MESFLYKPIQVSIMESILYLERPRMKRYTLEFTATMLLYLLILATSLLLLHRFDESPMVIRALISLAPVLPCGLLCWVVLRELRRLDELQLRIQFEALAFAFAATALTTFSYGFLQNVGAPPLSWLMVWPLMGLTWIIGLGMARRRYR
ncbi:hypothetical protein thsps117_41890 [Pseudomonas sp. No.117]|jgi:hypothetical protein